MADLTPEHVLGLPAPEFQELVNRDLRIHDDPNRRTPAEQALRDALRNPLVASRLFETVLVMQKSVEAQLAARKEENAVLKAECLLKGEAGRQIWLNTQVEYGRWRASSIRFKAGVERVLFEARQLRKLATDEHLAGRVRSLEDAIMRHRHDVTTDANATGIASEADLDLWSLVHGVDRVP